MKVGDLVISAGGWRGHGATRRWHTPKLIVARHATAKALFGVLFDDEIKYIHYKHLEVVSEAR